MTNEEAIIEMQQMKKEYCNTHTDAQLKKDHKILDALDIGIKAVKTLKQEPCKDAISRFEALEALNSINGTSELDKAFEVIEELPSFTPKPKTDVLDKIRAEIEQVKYIMNEEIINHDRKDLINFVNGLNQSLAIIDKYKAESEDKNADSN